MSRIETLMEKILPHLHEGAKEREEVASRIIEENRRARRMSEAAIFMAYRKAGLQIGLRHPGGKRWDDS